MSVTGSLVRLTVIVCLVLCWNPSPMANAGSVAAQPSSTSLPDGAGGAILVWSTSHGGLSYEILAQRVNAAGEAQWTEGGVRLSLAGFPVRPQLASDGAGGAIVTWQSAPSSSGDIYAQRLSAAGVPQWTVGGVALCTAAGQQRNPVIVSDGAGGAIVTWQDERAGLTTPRIYAQRADGAGVPQWTADGVALCTVAYQYTPTIAPDGAGGAIIAWNDNRSGSDIYAQRVSPVGAPLWTADGVAICTVAGTQSVPHAVPDEAGGALIAWTDYRSPSPGSYCQRVSSAGAPQWAADGVAICTAAGGQSGLQTVPDGAGGAIIAWTDNRTNPDIYAQRVSGAGAPLWTSDGVPVCTAADEQSALQVVSDGTGGAVLTWEDSRNGFAIRDIYAQRIDGSGAPQWSDNGLSLCSAAQYQTTPQIASDGSGGAIVSWSDGRSFDEDEYTQRVSASGSLQWTIDGVGIGVDPGVQRFPAVCSDGAGGAIVAWQEKAADNYDIHVRRFDGTGTPLWPAVVVCGAPKVQRTPVIAPDETGGAFVVWEDYRSGTNSDIYAQHVSGLGEPLWTPDGMALCTAAADQTVPCIAPDGGGGAIIAWQDLRGGTASGIYAQHVSAPGAMLWASDGAPVSTGASESNPQVVSDGGPGAIVTWEKYNGGFDIFANRLGALGLPLWTSGGVALCTVGAALNPQIVSDGAGGAIVAWEDLRTPSGIYSQRVSSAGAPLWADDGVALVGAPGTPQIVSDGVGGAIVSGIRSTAGVNHDVDAQRVSAAGTPIWGFGVPICTAAGDRENLRITSDGASGAIIAWEDSRSGSLDIYARKVTATGIAQWTADGVAVCTAAGAQWKLAMTGDGAGGALIDWADRRDGVQEYLYAQRLSAAGALQWGNDGTTPTLVSLVSAEARLGLVRLTWYAAGASGLKAVVERATGAGWSARGTAAADGTGHIVWEDHDVIPGTRYGYRLGWLDSGVEGHSEETWVDVPRELELALLGSRPNPAAGELWVWLALPTDAPAMLRLFDVTGRRVRERALAGAGARGVNLTPGTPLPPGVYVARLTQGTRSVSQRIAVRR